VQSSANAVHEQFKSSAKAVQTQSKCSIGSAKQCRISVEQCKRGAVGKYYKSTAKEVQKQFVSRVCENDSKSTASTLLMHYFCTVFAIFALFFAVTAHALF
jgi:Ca2+-binding EF-hand superfamily protein